MVVKVSALNLCRDGAGQEFRYVFWITSGVMVNEKQKCESNWKRKKCLFAKTSKSNLSDKTYTSSKQFIFFQEFSFK